MSQSSDLIRVKHGVSKFGQVSHSRYEASPGILPAVVHMGGVDQNVAFSFPLVVPAPVGNDRVIFVQPGVGQVWSLIHFSC